MRPSRPADRPAPITAERPNSVKRAPRGSMRQERGESNSGPASRSFLADGVGFEPTVGVNPRRFSSLRHPMFAHVSSRLGAYITSTK